MFEVRYIDTSRLPARHHTRRGQAAASAALANDAIANVCCVRPVARAQFFQAHAILQRVEQAHAAPQKIGRDMHQDLVDESCL